MLIYIIVIRIIVDLSRYVHQVTMASYRTSSPTVRSPTSVVRQAFLYIVLSFARRTRRNMIKCATFYSVARPHRWDTKLILSFHIPTITFNKISGDCVHDSFQKNNDDTEFKRWISPLNGSKLQLPILYLQSVLAATSLSIIWNVFFSENRALAVRQCLVKRFSKIKIFFKRIWCGKNPISSIIERNFQCVHLPLNFLLVMESSTLCKS